MISRNIFAVTMQVILQGDRAVIGAGPLLTVEPLLQALRDVRYVYLEDLRLWNVVMPYEMIAAVVGIFEGTITYKGSFKCYVTNSFYRFVWPLTLHVVKCGCQPVVFVPYINQLVKYKCMHNIYSSRDPPFHLILHCLVKKGLYFSCYSVMLKTIYKYGFIQSLLLLVSVMS